MDTQANGQAQVDGVGELMAVAAEHAVPVVAGIGDQAP